MVGLGSDAGDGLATRRLRCRAGLLLMTSCASSASGSVVVGPEGRSTCDAASAGGTRLFPANWPTPLKRRVKRCASALKSPVVRGSKPNAAPLDAAGQDAGAAVETRGKFA